MADLPTDKVVNLILRTEGVPLHIEFERSVVVGRAHPATGYIPDIDLTPYGGSLQGVSRSHIELTRKGTLLDVKDLGSTNGTWLNGRQLKAGERVLRDGDYLHLGHFELYVEFLTEPPVEP